MRSVQRCVQGVHTVSVAKKGRFMRTLFLQSRQRHTFDRCSEYGDITDAKQLYLVVLVRTKYDGCERGSTLGTSRSRPLVPLSSEDQA